MGAVEDILFFASVFREFGFPVEFEDGWERRGNGSTANYQGGIVHHTAIPATYANPGPGTRVLRDGRTDLSGPLCQWQGKFNGAVRCIAAHPANHAGASGGRSMGPLPVSRLFNPLVQGLEIDYAGNSPMSPEQYRAALVFAIACKRRYGSIERCRAHMETSIEGKWDPGFAPGRTIDMNQFRRDALALEASGGTTEGDNELDARERNALLGVEGVLAPGGIIRVMLEAILEKSIGMQFALGTAETATATEANPHGLHIGSLVADIWRRGVAEVDEDELAAAMQKRGMGTVDPALVKQAVAEVLTKGTDALADNQNREVPTR